MNLSFIIALFAVGISTARLGFYGSIYKYGDFGNLSPQQVAYIKEILKLQCLQMHGRRFC